MSAIPSPLLDELEAQAAAASPGFRRAVLPRHTIEARADGPLAGLWIEVADLTNEDVLVLKRNQHVFDFYRLAAPHVLAWNVEAPVWETVDEEQAEWGGTIVPPRTRPVIARWERLEPPAVAGPDAFLRASYDVEIVNWIVRRLRGFSEELDATVLKALTRPAPGSAGASAPTEPGATAASS